MLSSLQVYPREGNLGQMYHVFAFLKNNPKLTLHFDPRYPITEPSWFQGNSLENFKDKY